MAARVVVLYGPQADSAKFDSYYESTHVPLAKRIPGLRRYLISAQAPVGTDGSQPFHLIAQLEFDSLAAIASALRTPEGVATAADFPNFVSGPVQLVLVEDREV